MVKINNK